MARTLQTFLDRLRQSITQYYAATHSTDTNVYQILQNYGTQFVSGSLELDVVRNNAFVLECSAAQLFNNFGTFFTQPKYYLQLSTDDRYFSSAAVYTYTIPSTSFQYVQSVSSSYFDSFQIKGQQSAMQLNHAPGYALGSDVSRLVTVQAFGKLWINSAYRPSTYDIYTPPHIISFDPVSDTYAAVDPTIPGNADLTYPESVV